MQFIHSALQLKAQCASSREIALTDEHMSLLGNLVSKFRAARTNGREKLVEEAAGLIKSTWTEDAGFDRDEVIKVCDLSAKLGYSHVFLAYPRVPVRKG